MSKSEEDIQGKRYSPVGECIYCGLNGGADGLRSEHIIPYSLGGKTELPEASCSKCEGITSYLDGYLARAIYYHLRVHTGTQSRSGHPDVPPAEIEMSDGSKTLFLPTARPPFFSTCQCGAILVYCAAYSPRLISAMQGRRFIGQCRTPCARPLGCATERLQL